MPFQALYYPSWNPSVRWVRSTLLVFDQLQVIRPTEVVNPRYHEANVAVYELLPHAFSEIRRAHYDMTLSPNNKRLLFSTLNLIADKYKRNTLQGAKLRFTPGEGAYVPGYVYLHLSKIPDFVRKALESRGLFHAAAEQILKHQHNLHDFRIVQRDAAAIILALIADYYGRAHALRTVTDQRLAYLNVALNENPVRRHAAVEASLATAILRFQIPERIAEMNPEQYVSLRKRYDDLRLPFQHAVRTICDDNLLAGIESRQQFEDAVHSAGREFSLGVDKLLRSPFARKVGQWAPMSFGIASSLCKLSVPAVAILGVGVDCAVKLYNGLSSKGHSTEIHTAQKLMATLRRELISPITMRRIVWK